MCGGLIQNMDIITHGKVHIREIHHSIIPILAQNLKVITERGGVPLQKMKWTSYPDVRIWFMNSTIGLFLPFGGSHGGSIGSKTTPPDNAGSEGAYWCLDANGSTFGYLLYLTTGGESRTGYFPRTNGQSVRCVKNK